MAVYYNEFDPFAAEWLRRLIKAGHLPAGDVDQRDIRNISPNDLKPYTQCHFFAGIGGWPLALQTAGWPEDKPVWTGSCPCQPFSNSGQRKGFDDERHLWPDWFHLIKARQPATIFGEQVASPDALHWFDLVSTDLETSGYAVGAADICAASLGVPHIRQRLWFGATRRMAHAPGTCAQKRVQGSGSIQKATHIKTPDRITRSGQTGHSRYNTPWQNPDWIWCQDGKWRPTEPSLCPLANGISTRVGRLRAYGNAIVPQVAANFVEAFDEALTDSQIIPFNS